ncbi:hypothetical protein Q5752_002950 [Cryptotrichosporon argae]
MSLLDPILSGTLLPHQPLVIITHTTATSPTLLLKAVLARIPGPAPATLVSFLRPPARYRPPEHVEVLDLSGRVRGYGSGAAGVLEELEDAGKKGGTVVLDAVDLLVEDVGLPAAMGLIKRLLPSKPPFRLVLTLTHGSPLLQHVVPPSLSASLVLLTPHQPAHVAHLAREYLVPPSDERMSTTLDAALLRGATDALAFQGVGDIGPEPASVASRPSRRPAFPPQAIQVLVRKPTGGAKAIQRGLEALLPTPGGFEVGPVDSVVSVDFGAAAAVAAVGKTHGDLNLPFNLGLTQRQKKERKGVALPYAHEGEGADLGMGMDWEEDEEDDEI